MAKKAASQLITDILFRMGLYTAGIPERADTLAQLNVSSREIMQAHSLRFLESSGTLAVVGSSVAIPATIDASKAMTLGRVSGDGEIVYVPTDDWYKRAIDTYGQGAAQTEPTLYTVIGPNFVFKPAGLTATVPYIAQLRIVALTDDGASFSQLPEGWEDTLLAIDAEAELRRHNSQSGADTLKARANAKREELYGSERSTKEKPWVDREQNERKIAKAQLSDEATP